MAALELADEIQGEWLIGLSGALSVLFGILAGLYPRSGALAIIWLIGLYAILGGVTRVYIAYRLRGMGKKVESVLQPGSGHS